jgi:hypothetical protein
MSVLLLVGGNANPRKLKPPRKLEPPRKPRRPRKLEESRKPTPVPNKKMNRVYTDISVTPAY